MRLSQGHLNLLATCPRKYQHTFIDQLGSPTTPEQQEKQAWGSRFHLLMQQRELGLPIESIIQEDAQLQRWVTGLVGVAPDILTPNPNSEAFRDSEHCRTLAFGDYLLTVIYDLLIADIKSAQILDWKTYPKPQKRQNLAQNWQTRLYLYVLAETSDYAPEQISMTYWFVQSQPEAKSLKFTYNAGLHEQTRRDLSRLLHQLTDWLRRYEKGEEFPLVEEPAGTCDFCQYAVRCNMVPEPRRDIAPQRWRDRTAETGESETNKDLMLNLASIQEVSL
ncbi:MAG TPA: PD-(D/E)XK nuclease family protein [Cyanobacteria bacterium UBA11371]|nr:PD-(D/E)XK nuclease family protein [Cyanobacteria bacterium UBA11371]HBE30815.1 PD-(D/E)XK nuclease family protein [Cyanobacteria bacterium UBA11368]